MMWTGDDHAEPRRPDTPVTTEIQTGTTDSYAERAVWLERCGHGIRHTQKKATE